MEVPLVAGKRKAPKAIAVPVPGKAEDDAEKRGPGRPPGSGSKGKKGDDDDSLALLLKAGIDMIATMRAQQKGPHWLTITQSSEEIGKLTSKIIDKWFPLAKLTKYADEVRLLVVVGQAFGTPLLIDIMAAKAEEQPAQQEQSKGGGSESERNGPSNVRHIGREEPGAKSHAGPSVKHSGPAVIPG